jgi:hypothetical protein
MSGRGSTRLRSASGASQARERNLSYELRLMADDITSKSARPVRRRFTQLIDALERAKARYAICGATAMGAHGARRFTEDIDVLVDAADIDGVVEELSASMRELGREPAEGPVKQVRMRSKRAKGPSGVDIDLLVPVDVIEAWALATPVRARAFDRKVDVASPEALVLMKLRAYLSAPSPPGQVFTAATQRPCSSRVASTSLPCAGSSAPILSSPRSSSACSPRRAHVGASADPRHQGPAGGPGDRDASRYRNVVCGRL